MKAKVYDSGSIKTVLVQDDNGDKFITGLEELLDMMDGEDNWEIETTNSKPLTEKLYKYNKLMREVGEIRREIESYNTSKVFPVNELFKDFEMEHNKKVVDNYLKSNDLQLGKIEPYTPLPIPDVRKFPASMSGIKPASEDKDYTGMKVEMDGITGTVEYTDVHDGLALRFRGEHGFMDLTPGGIKMPRYEIDDIMMWIYMRQLQEGTWDVFDEKIGLGAQADTPSEAIKLYLEKLRDNDFVGRGYLSQVGITEDTRMIGDFNKCKNIINIEVVLKYNELLKKDEREDMAMKGGEQEPTLDVLFVFFNIKDISGEPVPHFMVPSLTTNNAYIMEEGCDDPASLVKKALGDYKLSAGDMEYLGWEGDTPPRITKEDVKDMVHVDDCLLVTRKVPRKLIARE
jgi:hypothetical protein